MARKGMGNIPKKFIDVVPDEFVKAVEKEQEELQVLFYDDRVQEIIEKKKDEKDERAVQRDFLVEVSSRDGKRALVVVGALTGNSIVDAAMHNTAREAESDLKDRGYATDLLECPSGSRLRGLLSGSYYTAFCFVGHGGDKKEGDSGDGVPGGVNGNDFLWINNNEVITSYDVQRWRSGSATDVVILHACVQGQSNTARRWQTAFGVSASNYHSWSGACDYVRAFWWQQIWR